MKNPIRKLAATSLTLALFIIGTAGSVQAVDLIGGTNPAFNNGDFSLSSNFGTIGGGVLTTDVTAQIGSGPWNGTARGVLGILVPPTISINGAANPGDKLNATISGLTAVNTQLGLVQNGGSVFETVDGNPGGTLPAGPTQYCLTGTFSSTDFLTANLLANSGFGVAITTGGTQGTSPTPGTDVANSFTMLGGGLFTLTIDPLTSMSGSFSLIYDSPVLLDPVGVRLFTGENPVLVSTSVLSNVTFDNIFLKATAIPEPSTWALALFGAGALVMLARRKRSAALS
ncbi:MAG: PEP-CTERM sorting domain-containing protein [Chthoniobacterales bacterium]|nr:PEP-CTERM sorting domain-containing protein [Chthoniobacterales bacterium]